jgi:hypothetical protein
MSVKTSTEAKAQTYAQRNVKSPFTLNSQAAALSRSDLERLEAEYHGPTLPNAGGDPGRLNERFWAALFAHENKTIYEPFEDRLCLSAALRSLGSATPGEPPRNVREADVRNRRR